MLHITLILCDCILVATCKGGENDLWEVVCTDALTGKTAKAIWTNGQLAAVTALGIAGDPDKTDSFHPVLENLYVIAESAIRDWPKECRPIP